MERDFLFTVSEISTIQRERSSVGRPSGTEHRLPFPRRWPIISSFHASKGAECSLDIDLPRVLMASRMTGVRCKLFVRFCTPVLREKCHETRLVAVLGVRL
jgi:hypothetical protein